MPIDLTGALALLRQGRSDARTLLSTSLELAQQGVNAHTFVRRFDTQARAAAQAASQKAAEKAKRERDEIPPPPEPVDFEEEEPEASIREVAPYSREDEERDMAEQARDEEGSADRRDATQVAMDLLAQELGAKPL